MAIRIKTKEQIEAMKEGGKITARALQEVLSAMEVGTSTAELDKIAEDFILAAGGEPAFKRVPGYDFTTCLNLNEGVVHGRPSRRKLREGDILSADLGTYYKGLNTDASWTVYVGDKRRAARDTIKFLRAGEEALWAAIGQAKVGNRVGDISRAIQSTLERRGFTPVDILVGHGVGEELHEEPQIPCLVIHGEGPELREGMTLAIEVIYTAGSPALKILPDGWTFVTVDASLAGLFEHSIAVTAGGPIVLTGLG